MKYVAYYRVSTLKQGKSGLGLEAQQEMVRNFIRQNGGQLVVEYQEVESGKHDERHQLIKAMRHAHVVGGKLLVGKLDRLSRDLHFITSLQKSQVDFIVADMPNCDSFTINIYGALAQRERELISERTKAGLAAAKARGVKLGKPENLTKEVADKGRQLGRQQQSNKANRLAAMIRPRINELKNQGLSLRAIAATLDSEHFKTARGGKWTASSVKNILKK
jgi:DNA invertase Pin-like site-specific DNA recombinase